MDARLSMHAQAEQLREANARASRLTELIDQMHADASYERAARQIGDHLLRHEIDDLENMARIAHPQAHR